MRGFGLRIAAAIFGLDLVDALREHFRERTQQLQVPLAERVVGLEREAAQRAVDVAVLEQHRYAQVRADGYRTGRRNLERRGHFGCVRDALWQFAAHDLAAVAFLERNAHARVQQIGIAVDVLHDAVVGAEVRDECDVHGQVAAQGLQHALHAFPADFLGENVREEIQWCPRRVGRLHESSCPVAARPKHSGLCLESLI
jgi:hypothetical protein